EIRNPAFNNALSPDIVGETTFELFNFTQQNLNRPIDIFEIMQRTTIEVLGNLAFGYQFVLEIQNSSKLNEFNDIIKAKRNEIENKKVSNDVNSENGRIDLLT
ncbi:11438_t:CDS:2, partial [Funneliformis caledonium]